MSLAAHTLEYQYAFRRSGLKGNRIVGAGLGLPLGRATAHGILPSHLAHCSIRSRCSRRAGRCTCRSLAVSRPAGRHGWEPSLMPPLSDAPPSLIAPSLPDSVAFIPLLANSYNVEKGWARRIEFTELHAACFHHFVRQAIYGNRAQCTAGRRRVGHSTQFAG